MIVKFEKSVELPVPVSEAFAWHERAGALRRMSPPWEDVRVLDQYGGIRDGAETTIQIRKGPCKLRWVAMHQNFLENVRFQDIQVSGPFKSWSHIHRFEAVSPQASRLTDMIDYELPGGWLGGKIAGAAIAKDIQRGFTYRHHLLRSDLSRHQQYRDQPRQRVLISGGTGLIGSNLTAFLDTGGHEIVHLTRKLRGKGEGQIQWSPGRGELPADCLSGFDTVIHLAGENIFGLWTDQKKAAIRNSRVESTRQLVQAMANCQDKPRTLICASAIGFYGNRGDEILDESSPAGGNWLAQIAQEWEGAAQVAREAGVRVVFLRLGVVLTPAGGALGKMLPPFKLGCGGRIGSGRQWMSWVSIEDVIGGFHHAMMSPDLEGPVNLVSPEPVTNAAFTHTLGKLLRRPTLFPIPAFAGKMVMGEMFEELLLSSTRVTPGKLSASGYSFSHPHLPEALGFLMGR